MESEVLLDSEDPSVGNLKINKAILIDKRSGDPVDATGVVIVLLPNRESSGATGSNIEPPFILLPTEEVVDIQICPAGLGQTAVIYPKLTLQIGV